MIDHQLALTALRTQALTLSVVTTGSTTLSVTSAAYVRAAGSFITDGFVVGMEVTGAGFSVSGNNGAHRVTAVSALSLTCDGLATEASASGKTVSVGLPALRAWENIDFTPVAGRWFVEEDYLPGPAVQETLGQYGQVETLPQYVLRLYGLANTSTAALFKASDALLALFAPRTPLVLSDGNVVVVRTNPAPYRGQLLQAPGGGWAVVPITIPCRVRSANSY